MESVFGVWNLLPTTKALRSIVGGSVLVDFDRWVGSNEWVDTPTLFHVAISTILTNVTIHNFKSTESNKSKLS